MNQRNGGLRGLILVALVSMIVLTMGQSVYAQRTTGIIRVALSGSDVNGCGSEANPCRTLRFGMQQAITANFTYQGEVRLAAGRYSESSDPKDLGFIGFPSNLSISGGYSSSDWNNTDPIKNQTILDGLGTRRAMTISVPDNIAAVCHVSISNLVIENGRSTFEKGNTYGGGILIDNCSDVKISNVTIRNSQALGLSNTGDGDASPGAGGAIAVRGNDNVKAGLVLQNVVMSGNRAIGGNESNAARGGLGVGGAIFAIKSNLTFNQVSVTDNLAQAGDAPNGSGAVGVQRADGLGGGIAMIHVPSFKITGLTAQGNKAEAGDASGLGGLSLGAGLFIEYSTGSISQAVIKENQALGGASSGANGEGGAAHGSAIFQTDSNLTLDRVSMLDNSATAAPANGPNSTGGNASGAFFGTIGVDTSTNSLKATNLIIARNTATSSSGRAANGGSNGGGLLLDQTAFDINHATIVANSFAGSGDKNGSAVGMFRSKTAGTIQNSIIADHVSSGAIMAGSGTGTIVLDSILSNGNTGGLIQAGSAAITQQNILSGDPKFVDPAGSNFHISAGSAAIDRANSNSLAIDIDGQPRPIGKGADLGADELQIDLIGVAGDTTIALSWQSPADITITRYEIEYTKSSGAADADEGASPIAVGTQTQFVLHGLTKNKSYSVKIIGYNGSTRVAESAVRSLNTYAFRVALPVVKGQP